MANEQGGGMHPRLGISAWLAVGLALGWLAVLATFVRGVGNLLTAWAATVSLTVLVARRRIVISPGKGTGDDPAALTGPATPDSGSSASVTTPQIAPGLAETGHEAAGRSAEPKEPGGETSTPNRTGHQPAVAEAPDSLSSDPVDSGPAPHTATQPPAVGPVTTVEDLRVLTAAEVALVLRVDVDTIILAIDNGELPGNRIGSHWRVDEKALVRWLQGTYRNSVS